MKSRKSIVVDRNSFVHVVVFVISTSVDKVGHHPEVLKSRSEVELEEVKKKNLLWIGIVV